ncbi:MAG: RNB domain-containing ribonuclease [Deltaproteobacteria bacterium]|nr:RNB domain-containing ribonuclease [Deltaproteobacteria bacterium]
MKPGTIVEYIDHQKIICATVLSVEGERVRLLSENGRELNQKTARLSHISKTVLDMDAGRDELVRALKTAAKTRNNLALSIDIAPLWEELHSIGEWVDLESMTVFCFSGEITSDHESAVVRAFFENRFYFKFDFKQFFPHPEKVVAQNIARKRAEERRKRIAETGAVWLASMSSASDASAGPGATGHAAPMDRDTLDAIEILKSFYLIGRQSQDASTAKSIMAKAGVKSPDTIFTAMVRAEIWDETENIDIYRYGISTDFSPQALEAVGSMASSDALGDDLRFASDSRRVDLTGLDIMTIDGPATLDYDDALSIEKDGNICRIGVHIADVASFVEKGGILDREVINRGTSIYMPDLKIPMLPNIFSENICSLKEREIRPAVSLFIKLTRDAQVIDYEFLPSIISVHRKLTYTETDALVKTDDRLSAAYAIAKALNENRLKAGAVQIQLPEISVRLLNGNEVSVRKIDRESPGRFLVSEMMILANRLAAKFLTVNKMPAVFRSQPAPRGRLYSGAEEGTLFDNWMQRRLISRVVISAHAGHHSGLGVDAYATATSPIRKYYDLITQRQIKACLGMESPYSEEEIGGIISALNEPLRAAGQVQFRRHRYWIFKFLEKCIGERMEAIVLDKRRDGHMILILDYLIECLISAPPGMKLKPKDMVRITLQYIDAARDRISVMLE